MPLYFEITDGARRGERFRIQQGLRFGRRVGEILLNDPKVSGLHAQVEQDKAGRLFIVDKNSSNGIKINGLSAKRALLLPGLTLQVGKTQFTVIEMTGQQTVALVHEAPKSAVESLTSAIMRLPLVNASTAKPILPFFPALKLVFLEGLQAESEVTLGYGPRDAGSDTLDVDLHEDSAPPLAFSIAPVDSGAEFSTSFPQIVRINDESVKVRLLQSGDLIRIGKTLIRVELL